MMSGFCAMKSAEYVCDSVPWNAPLVELPSDVQNDSSWPLKSASKCTALSEAVPTKIGDTMMFAWLSFQSTAQPGAFLSSAFGQSLLLHSQLALTVTVTLPSGLMAAVPDADCGFGESALAFAASSATPPAATRPTTARYAAMRRPSRRRVRGVT